MLSVPTVAMVEQTTRPPPPQSEQILNRNVFYSTLLSASSVRSTTFIPYPGEA